MRGGFKARGILLSLCQIWFFRLNLFDRAVQKYYHARPMTVIDSLEFAQTGQSLRGSLPIAGLTRLRESLADTLGEVEFVVQGGRDHRRRLILSLDVSGVLHLQCQRCLGTLDYPLRFSNRLVLVQPGEAAAGGFEAEDAEWIEASSALDAAGLIEEEILLSLPYAPRHEAGACGQGPGSAAGTTGVSAFAKLAALKRNRN